VFSKTGSISSQVRTSVATVRFLSFATQEVADVVSLEREPDWSFRGLAMSPDGRYLLSVQIDREANDLMMIENFH
jgi:hypothetical protein